jgi:23S rRNA pseudouridine1911/1915/1917 synthase
MEFIAEESDNGTRLDVCISAHLPDVSRSKIQQSIVDSKVTLNGSVVPKNTTTRPGDCITIVDDAFAPQSTTVAGQDIPITVLWEDGYAMAINKPAGLVVHPGNGNPDGTLVNALVFHNAGLSQGSEPLRPGIIHRLDKDTSGVIIVAKTDAAHAAFSDLFAQRIVKKQYTGVCIGKRPQDTGTIDAALGRSRQDPVKRTVREDGRAAVTDYSLIKYRDGISVVAFSPQTGRTHQIRVHSKHAGFPIISDSLYGDDKAWLSRIPPLERPFAHSIVKCFKRHALHARKLTFIHPFTHAEIVIKAEYPADFVHAMKLFGIESN